ncbi:MAG TPA: LTA synthase family protein [Clostridiales bacterium]|nr:LTA synthase family protein [Clostridiales bacterium]
MTEKSLIYRDGHRIVIRNYYINLLAVLIFSLGLSVLGILLSDVVDIRNILRYVRSPLLFLLNMLPLLFLMLLLYHVSSRHWFAFGIGGGVYIIAHIVNRFMMELREEPFLPADILLGTEAATVVRVTELPFDRITVLSLVFWIVFTVLLFVFVRSEKLKWPVRTAGAVAVVVLFLISFFGIYKKTELYNSFKVDGSEYSKVNLYKSRGFMYSFLVRTGAYRSIKPEGYDRELAKSGLSQYVKPGWPEVSGKKPHIIAVMGEAFYDMDRIPGIEFNEGYDPLANFNRIKQMAYHGRIVTNVFGGGTANTEFSFLTGHSMPVMPELTSPYSYYIRHDTFSLARVLEKHGYATMAFHPGESWFYNRVNVYRFFGFDSIYFKNDMDLGNVEINHGYISDQDTAEFLLEKFREQLGREPDRPFFQFVVNIDNHGPYSKKDIGYPQILKKSENMDEATYNILNNYLNGLMRCDRALGWLADSIMEMEEPVVFIYFSDHLPWLGENDVGYRALGFGIDPDGSLQEYLNKYETPYFILINGSAEKLLLENGVAVKKGQGPQISVNYLAVELLESVGLNGGNYFNYLSELRKEIPVISSRFIKEKDTFTEKPSKETKGLLDMYSIIQYYMLTDKDAVQ